MELTEKVMERIEKKLLFKRYIEAGIMLIRRDVTVEDWSDPRAGKYGVKATTRFGLGVLQSNAIAKMVNIKTSL